MSNSRARYGGSSATLVALVAMILGPHALRAGAQGYVMKEEALENVVAAIRQRNVRDKVAVIESRSRGLIGAAGRSA